MTEIVEKKGIGHPDSLAGQIAENLCWKICCYYKNKYKSIYRFNVDQVEIIGGEVKIDFGHGKIIKPGFVTISGKATCLSAKECKRINEIAITSSKKLLVSILGRNIIDFFRIKSNIKAYSKRNVDFFEHPKIPLSEDTAVGIGFYPQTLAEKMAADVEKFILKKIIKRFPVGKDIKIMIVNERKSGKIEFIVSLAFLGEEIKNINEYFLIKEKIKSILLAYTRKMGKQNTEVVINAADNRELGRTFITLSGTSAEHDQGSVGRGNNASGLITPFRHISTEVIYGKNPVYHVGKIYNILAFYLAKKISEILNNKGVEVSILSKLGNPINIPQVVNVNVNYKTTNKEKRKIRNTIFKEYGRLFKIVPGTNYTKFTQIILTC
jgi:S-adenosylmethionine synthetase